MTELDLLPCENDPGIQCVVDRIAERVSQVMADLEVLRDGGVSGTAHPVTAAHAALLRLVNGNPGRTDRELLGIPISGARVLVAPPLRPGAARDVVAMFTADKETVCTQHPVAGLVAVVRGRPHEAGKDRALQHAISFAQRAHGSDRSSCIGISAPIERYEDFPAAMADALDAVEVRDPDAPCWVLVEDVWARIAMHRLRTALPSCLPLAHPLQRLAEYEAKRRGELTATVGAWLAANSDTAATATALSVHPNTLRYRIRRVEEVSGLDLSDGDQRVVAHLALAYGDTTWRGT